MSSCFELVTAYKKDVYSCASSKSFAAWGYLFESIIQWVKPVVKQGVIAHIADPTLLHNTPIHLQKVSHFTNKNSSMHRYINSVWMPELQL
jgi:hypothetical protein